MLDRLLAVKMTPIPHHIHIGRRTKMSPRQLSFAVLLLCLVALGCSTGEGEAPDKETARIEKTKPVEASTAQLFENMGNHELKISTNSPKAQEYFNQGLTWLYAFNHSEAIRSLSLAPRNSMRIVRWRGGACPLRRDRTTTLRL